MKAVGFRVDSFGLGSVPKLAKAEPTNLRDQVLMLPSGHPYLASGLEAHFC